MYNVRYKGYIKFRETIKDGFKDNRTINSDKLRDIVNSIKSKDNINSNLTGNKLK